MLQQDKAYILLIFLVICSICASCYFYGVAQGSKSYIEELQRQVRIKDGKIQDLQLQILKRG